MGDGHQRAVTLEANEFANLERFFLHERSYIIAARVARISTAEKVVPTWPENTRRHSASTAILRTS